MANLLSFMTEHWLLTSSLPLVAGGVWWWSSRKMERQDHPASEASAGGESMGGKPAHGEALAAPPKLPRLDLLRRWRDNGSMHKAYYEARRGMIMLPEAYPIWLFAAEMAALNYASLQEAERMIRQLCRQEVFSMEQKTEAIESLKAWAAVVGYQLNLARFSQGESGLEKPPAVFKAERLRATRKFQEAARVLEDAILENPGDLTAVLMLARIYGLDLDQFAKTEMLVDAIVNEPHVCGTFAELAKRNLQQWKQEQKQRPQARRWLPQFALPFGRSRRMMVRMEKPRADQGFDFTLPQAVNLPPMPTYQPPAPVYSVNTNSSREEPRSKEIHSKETRTNGVPQQPLVNAKDLLKTGHIGSAIEIMERDVEDCPDDYDASLQLAETYCQSCDNLKKAEDIVRRIQANPAFTALQKASAQSQLRDWTTECLRQRSRNEML